MKHALVLHVQHPDSGIGDEIGQYLTPDELLAAHPDIEKTAGAATKVRAMKAPMDGGVITGDIFIWCEDRLSPEDYSEAELDLGHRYHDALVALASAIETAAGAALVNGALKDDVNWARIRCRVGADLASALKDRMFEATKEPACRFEVWCRRTEDHIAIGAGPAVIRADAAELSRNMGLAQKGTPS